MNLSRHNVLSAIASVAIALFSSFAIAAPTGFAPDAWARANNADTSYFGWDSMEIAGPPNFGPLYLLDDSTPDLGSGITATATRIYQGNNGASDPAPTTNGHVSSSTNYYSFSNTAIDTITAVAPAGGTGGFTTVVLQVHSRIGGDAISDLQFAIDDSVNPWTLHKHLHGMNSAGLGFHWVEWSAPGADLPLSVKMTSTDPHRVIDSFEVDTYWSGGASAAFNAISAVPEPATWMLLLGGVGICGVRRRRSRIVAR